MLGLNLEWPQTVLALRRRLVVAAIVCMVAVPAAYAECSSSSTVRAGFATGVDLVNLDDSALAHHLMGFVNGMLVAPFVGGSEACYEQMWGCLHSRSNQQLVAMVRRYLSDHPEEWHSPANIIAYNAIVSSCTGGVHADL